MIKVWILDDDENSRFACKTALFDYPDVHVAKLFDTPSSLQDALQTELPNLLILDIELKEELGFDIAKQVKKMYPSVLIVFLTGHSSYAIDGYEFHPVDFLTKPIRKAKLDAMMGEVRARLSQKKETKESATVMFKTISGYSLVELDSILYIKHEDRKNFIVTSKGPFRIGNYTMHEIEEMLENHGFFQCFQSYIIPLSKVIGIRDIGKRLFEIDMEGTSKKIPLSRNKYDELLDRLKEKGIFLEK